MKQIVDRKSGSLSLPPVSSIICNGNRNISEQVATRCINILLDAGADIDAENINGMFFYCSGR